MTEQQISLLNAAIHSMGMNVIGLVRRMGISRVTYYRHVSGETPFNRDEMQKIREILNLTDAEFMEIFFNSNVA